MGNAAKLSAAGMSLLCLHLKLTGASMVLVANSIRHRCLRGSSADWQIMNNEPLKYWPLDGPVLMKCRASIFGIACVWFAIAIFTSCSLQGAETKTSILLKGIGVLLGQNRPPPSQPTTVKKSAPLTVENLIAVTKLENEAQAGNVNAQVRLGHAYATGAADLGIKQDDKESFKWLLLAAQQGHAEAQFCIGYMYGQGRGIAKNEEAAVNWVLKAAETGSADAQFCTAQFYLNGTGVPVSDTEAVKWLKKASNQGHSEAQFWLGYMYGEGRGIATDDVEAVKWFSKSADKGNANAQYYMALSYMSGAGVTPNEAEAVKWLQKAANQNHADAQLFLAIAFTDGKGVMRDEKESIKWLIQSAKNGNDIAQHTLGLYYMEGDKVPKDEAEGFKWMEEAAFQGRVESQRVLASFYTLGKGVAADNIEAYKWMLISGANNDAKTKETFEAVERSLSKEQRTIGQNRAKGFIPH